jgi:beta-phosphoglucomutase-like phosphatase (HAD superfamily)
MVLQAAEAFGIAPADCVVIGDRGADIDAAAAAGARALLVRSDKTAEEDVRRAPLVADSLSEAVDLVLACRV